MPTVRNTVTRPNTEVPFFSYDDMEYFLLITSRHEYDTQIMTSYDELTRVIEMTFANVEELNAWDNDPERMAMAKIVREYNAQNGITDTREILA